MYCSKCGSTIADGSASCPNCGPSTYGAPVAVAGGAPLAAASAVGPSWLPASASTRAYAGFWLRFVAYLVDAIVLGIFVVPILVGAGMMMGLATAVTSLPHGSDPFSEGFPPVFAEFLFGIRAGSRRRHMAVSRVLGEFGVAGHRGQEGSRFGGDGFGRGQNFFRARVGAPLCEDNYGPDSLGRGIHPRGGDGKKAGAPRHDRGLPGAAQVLRACVVTAKTGPQRLKPD